MFAEVITLKIKAMDEIIFYIVEGAAICGLFLLSVKFFEPINRLMKRLTGIDLEME